MAESDRPQSPFAGMADLSARTPLRILSPDGIERMLAEHRLYLETEYHEGHRANFSSADLTGRKFSGLTTASLFHVPSQELPRVLLELFQTLKPRGQDRERGDPKAL